MFLDLTHALQKFMSHMLLLPTTGTTSHLLHFKFISKSSYPLGYFKLATVKIFYQKTVAVSSILKVHYLDIILLNFKQPISMLISLKLW